MRALCAALKANQKPCPCRRARHPERHTRAVCLAWLRLSAIGDLIRPNWHGRMPASPYGISK